jgi:hypothetical protein
MFWAEQLAELGDVAVCEPDVLDDGSALDDGDALDARLDVIAERGRAIATQIAVLQAELVVLAAEARTLEGRLATGTTRQWLAWQWGLTPSEAGRAVRLAQRLDDLPRLSDAFAEGSLSEGTVDLLTRVATPSNEHELLATAAVATGSQLATLVSDLRRVTDDPPADEHDELLTWWTDEAGRVRLKGRLAPDHGAAFAAAIDVARQRDLDDAGAGAEPLDNPGALAAVVDQYLASSADDRGVIPARFLTVVHHDTATGSALHDGGAIDEHLASQLWCESWAAAVVSRRGRPVTATSPRRLATVRQLLALLVRDRCCTFPGCGRTRHLRAHHLRHAADGGPTRLDNLVLLCPTHHRLIHRPGWGMSGTPPDGLVITTPHGPLERPARPTPSAPDPPSVPTRTLVPLDRLTEFGRDVVLQHWLN